MSISDDQFALWLENDSKQICVLAELDYITQVHSGPNYNPTSHTLYFANRPYRPSGGPLYRECLTSTPTFGRRIDQSNFQGKTTLSYGTVELDNHNGDIDFLINLIVDGQEMRFYMGDPSWAAADFRLAIMGVVQYVSKSSPTVVSLTLQDKMTLLNAPIENAAWTTDDQIRPVTLGYVENAPVYVEDAATLLYRMSWTAISFVQDVRDDGVSLVAFAGIHVAGTVINAAADTVSITAHNTAPGDCVVFFKGDGSATLPGGITAGVSYYVINSGYTPDAFKLSTTKGGSLLDITSTGSGNLYISGRGFFTDRDNGEFTLAASPLGTITCDVWGYTGASYPTLVPDKTDLTHVSVSAESIITKLVVAFSKLMVTDDYDAARFANWSDGVTTELLGVYIPARTNLINVLDFLGRHCFGWYGFDRAGVLDFGRLIAPTGIEAVTFSIGPNDYAIDGIEISQAFTPTNKVRIGVDKNWTVQSDGLAGAVTDAQRQQWAQPYLYTDVAADETVTVAYASAMLAPLRFHRLAVTAQPFDTAAYGDFGDAVVASGLFGNFLRPQLQIITVRGLSLQYWQTALGSIGTIGTGVLDRLGIAGDTYVVCIGIDTDITGQKVTLYLLRRNPPDVTTQTYA